MLPFRMSSNKRSVITGLNAKEEKFVQLLVDGLKNKKAYEESHGVGKASSKTITEKASRLAGRYNIKARFEQLTREQGVRCAINRDWIVDKLKSIVDVGTERTQIIKTKTKTSKNRGTLELIETETVREEHLESMVDSGGANMALDKLIKLEGLYAAEKSETEVKVKGKFVLNLRDRTDVA